MGKMEADPELSKFLYQLHETEKEDLIRVRQDEGRNRGIVAAVCDERGACGLSWGLETRGDIAQVVAQALLSGWNIHRLICTRMSPLPGKHQYLQVSCINWCLTAPWASLMGNSLQKTSS